MKKHIYHQIFFPNPVERVWDYLTKPELIELWLMKNNFQPIVGFDFQFQTNPIPGLDFDGIVYCRVLEIIPHKKLSYSWKSGPGYGEITLESIVTWRLESKDDGTELFLEHSGFTKEENLSLYNGLKHGWTEKLSKIAKLLITARDGKIKV